LSSVTPEWARAYERGRPGYPAAAVELPGLAPDATVLDLGAGTGKLTRVLTARFARALAVEPAADMRAVHGGEVVDGSAEAIPLAAASVDAVFAAEAFHWFATREALAEIARVLRGRGALALLWNLPDGPTEPPIDELETMLLALAPRQFEHIPLDLGHERFTSDAWREPFRDSAFGDLQELRLRHVQTVDAEGLVAFYGSMGWRDVLPERDAVLARARALLTAGEYRRPWETRVFWTRKET
jgi:SAM-dependent methyltransferase